MINGKCLCGDVEFVCDLNTNPLKIYQCHCSLCKKQSGASANSATMIPIENFKWIHQGTITCWQKETGFSSHFCATCGCPVPNLFGASSKQQYYWIPVGLLAFDGSEKVEVAANLCVSSQSSWQTLSLESKNFEALPDFKTLLTMLR